MHRVSPWRFWALTRDSNAARTVCEAEHGSQEMMHSNSYQYQDDLSGCLSSELKT